MNFISRAGCILLVSISVASADVLTCAQLGEILTGESSLDVRPYCDTAEIRCRALSLLEKKPTTDPLRRVLEIKLRAQVQYELEVCELALRQTDPDYLKPRN